MAQVKKKDRETKQEQTTEAGVIYYICIVRMELHILSAW